MLSIMLLPLLSGLPSLVVGFATPEACSGICTNAHDPSIIRRADGTYFRFSTGGLIPIHTAPAITGPWAFACEMLTESAKATVSGNAGTDLWAPDVSLFGDTYYVYYSVSSFGTQRSQIGLATSTSMDCGTFADLGSAGVSSDVGQAYNAIDAQLWNDDGTYRLQFGSFWNNLYQVTMNSPPTSPTSGATSVQLSYEPAGTHPEEAAFLIKKGSFYYLFFSYGVCCGYDATRPAAGTEYKIKVCRSGSPSSGFVSSICFCLFHKAQLNSIRSMQTAQAAFREVALSCWNLMIECTGQADKVFTKTRNKAGSWCTTTLILASDTLMVTSALAGTSLISALVGRLSSSDVRASCATEGDKCTCPIDPQCFRYLTRPNASKLQSESSAVLDVRLQKPKKWAHEVDQIIYHDARKVSSRISYYCQKAACNRAFGVVSIAGGGTCPLVVFGIRLRMICNHY